MGTASCERELNHARFNQLFRRFLVGAFRDRYTLQRWIELDKRVIDCAVLCVAIKASLSLHGARRSLRQTVFGVEGEEAPFFGKASFILHKRGNASQVGLEVSRAIRADVRS